MSTSIFENTKWKWKTLLFCQTTVIFLLCSLFLPALKGFWEVIDIAFFKVINGSLDGRPWWQVFWALANHRGADWVEDFVFLGFFIVYVRQYPSSFRLRKTAELIFCALYAAAIIYFINRLLFRENLSNLIPRSSPTRVLDSAICLTDYISWIKIKVSATKSFPGDHGTTALLFGGIFSILAKGRLRISALAYTVFLCMPRMITGAHWLSDILVGSGSIALFFLSLAFCTPLFSKCTNGIEKSLNACKELFRKRQTA